MFRISTQVLFHGSKISEIESHKACHLGNLVFGPTQPGMMIHPKLGSTQDPMPPALGS